MIEPLFAAIWLVSLIVIVQGALRLGLRLFLTGWVMLEAGGWSRAPRREQAGGARRRPIQRPTVQRPWSAQRAVRLTPARETGVAR